ncbi:YesL family protein [Metaplanococcus flavidus]|uniref:YesL family protein n=1 Tax=Metaplanococcus flavidus TaxID=569883 RepID=A0ABW3L865_9BACL
MLELKGISSVFYAMSEWIMRFSGVNLLWFGVSLPFFLLFVTVEMSSSGGLIYFGIAAWLLGSLLFFPATAAVFSVVRDWIMETEPSSIAKSYFKHLKADYRGNAKMGAFFSLIWLLWYYGYFYLYTAKNSLAIILLLFGLAMFVFTVNYLSINAHYRMSSISKVKNTFFLSAGKPLMSLAVAFVSGILLWLSTTQLLWLFPLASCSMIAFLSFSAFYRTAQKIGGSSAVDEPADS